MINPGEKAQVTLEPLGDATSQTLTIKIPVTETIYYLVENWQHIGYDKNLPEPGVLIMYADDTVAESLHGTGPVRLIEASPTMAHLESAALDIGKNASFTDEKNDVRIHLMKKNRNSYDIALDRR